MLLTYEDLAARWQVKVQLLRGWVMEKKLTPIKLSSKVRFSEKYIADIEKNHGLNWDKK